MAALGYNKLQLILDAMIFFIAEKKTAPGKIGYNS
jgi:hypothetical protein